MLVGETAKPDWLKIFPPHTTDFSRIKNALRARGLVTVCEEAQCPNMAECWHGENTVTFMVLGDTCTRGCRFCTVKKSLKGMPLDLAEPQKLALAIAEMGLSYAVITSVDRDDLPDGGASHFAECITRIRKECPATKIEVLIPDFRANIEQIKMIVNAGPDVIAHNIETVKSLQRKIRDPRAGYEQSIEVLRIVKRQNPSIYTKSAIMVGLGETKGEVIQAMHDLREAGCDILTIGQYLKPKEKQLYVEEYVRPEVFNEYKNIGESLGFIYVASGPFVRSSYRAGELFTKALSKSSSAKSSVKSL